MMDDDDGWILLLSFLCMRKARENCSRVSLTISVGIIGQLHMGFANETWLQILRYYPDFRAGA